MRNCSPLKLPSCASRQADAEFLYQMVGVIRHFGYPQARFPQVLLPVDKVHPGPGLPAELLINDGVKAPQLRIGFFQVDDRGGLIEQFAAGKSPHPVIDKNHAAL